jgi:hypothetical protein
MPGCCLKALLLFIGPRFALACAWLFSAVRRRESGWSPSQVLFLPWTSLAWMFVFHRHGDVSGGYVSLAAGLALGATSAAPKRRRRAGGVTSSGIARCVARNFEELVLGCPRPDPSMNGDKLVFGPRDESR